jgi:hypothetical protein
MSTAAAPPCLAGFLFAKTLEKRREDRPRRFGASPTSSVREAAWLFDQLQRDRGTSALTFRRFRMKRLFGRLRIPQHRIAQGFQFRVFNSIEFDPKLENGHRYQLGGVPVPAEHESRLALLKICQHRMQSFF